MAMSSSTWASGTHLIVLTLCWAVPGTENQAKTNKKIKLGICGEHGGDPKSIEFCSKINLDYVSCSPYRVPVARLSAAQSELKKG